MQEAPRLLHAAGGYVLVWCRGGIQTGGDWRLGYDVGAGAEFALGSTLRLGPMLRLQKVVPISADLPEDALAVVVGLSVTLQRRHLEARSHPPAPDAPSPTAPPSDRDHDGVLVEGHTDSQGNPDHNMDLSQRRAASVVRWLSAHGVEAERLASSGLGQTRPLRSNITARNRAMNRRVEFHVLDPAPVPAPAAPTAPGRARRRR